MLETDKPDYQFNGLNNSSIDLWRKWLALYQDMFYGFEYDVHVGQGIRPPGNASPKMAELWKTLTQKKIDVVCQRYGQTWIIEIMERAGLPSLGQVLGYVHLYGLYFKPQPVVIPAIISRYMGRDMGLALRAHGVYYFVFPGVGPPRVPPQFLPTLGGAPFTVDNPGVDITP